MGEDIMEKRIYTVYVHIFPNHKAYVGLTKQKIEKRWQQGIGYKKQPVYDAINYYGWDNIEHIIIQEHLTKEEAQELEKQTIKDFDSIEHGYNVSKGGGAGGLPWDSFEYNGQIYTSEQLSELSPLDNITGHDITNRINSHGWSIDDAIYQPKGNRNIKYVYNSSEYTLGELFLMRKNKDITYRQFCNRIIKHKWDIERALSQSNNKKCQPNGTGERIYEYNGKKYNSYELCQISPLEDLTPFDITNRINHHGWSVEKAITQPKKKRDIKFEYNGQNYNSHQIAEMCVDEKMTYHDVTDRYKSGWTIDEIINIPKGVTRKKYYNDICDN